MEILNNSKSETKRVRRFLMTYLDSYRNGFRWSAAAPSPLEATLLPPKPQLLNYSSDITTAVEQLGVEGQQRRPKWRRCSRTPSESISIRIQICH